MAARGSCVIFLSVINKGDVDAGKGRAWASALKISSVGINTESLSNEAVSSVPHTESQLPADRIKVGIHALETVRCDV